MTQFLPYSTPFPYATQQWPQATVTQPTPMQNPQDILNSFARAPGTSLSAHYNAILEQAKQEIARMDAAAGAYQSPYGRVPKVKTPTPSKVHSDNTGVVNVNIENVQNATFASAGDASPASSGFKTSWGTSPSASPWQVS